VRSVERTALFGAATVAYVSVVSALIYLTKRCTYIDIVTDFCTTFQNLSVNRLGILFAMRFGYLVACHPPRMPLKSATFKKMKLGPC
jgi:hypothetical protein